MPWRVTRVQLALLVFLLAVVICGVLLWRSDTPPLVARLLPESQGILYFDLQPIRAATHFDERPVPHAPDYQRFINATGINVERDLDQVAFSLDQLSNPLGPNGGIAYSEVLAGHFDAARLADYLSGIANDTESYDGRTIFLIPSEGRTVRVVILPGGLVAISNAPTPEQIHSIIDRDRTAWLPFASNEPTLLAEHYRALPALSLAWGLGQIGLPFGDHGEFHLFGFTLPIRLDATFVASLRWTGALRLRIEEIAPSEAAAKASAQALSALLKIGRMAENSLPKRAVNPGMQALLNSARVQQNSDRAVLTATLPDDLLRSLAQGASLSGTSR